MKNKERETIIFVIFNSPLPPSLFPSSSSLLLFPPFVNRGRGKIGKNENIFSENNCFPLFIFHFHRHLRSGQNFLSISIHPFLLSFPTFKVSPGLSDTRPHNTPHSSKLMERVGHELKKKRLTNFCRFPLLDNGEKEREILAALRRAH